MMHDEFTPMEPEFTQLNPENTRKKGKGPEIPPCPPLGFYATGPTRPPKERTGIIVVVLLVLLMMGGLFATLTLLNIRILNVGNKITTYFGSNGGYQGSQTSGPALLSTQTGGQELSLQQIYAANIDAVVSITTESASGTGVVLTNDGYLVTNYHVVEGASSISVLATDGREFSARLVGRDEVTDLAVLQVDASDLTPGTFGDSSQVQVGDTVAAIGDSLGVQLRGTLASGIISGTDRNLTVDGSEMTLLQTNIALNSGNSGGPLINRYGQIIGINTAKVNDLFADTSVESMGFAIPSNTVVEITTQLIQQGYVSGRPELGFDYEDLDSLTQAYFLLPSGAYVTQVDSGSNAYTAGLRAGDIVLSIDGQRITSAQELTAYKNNLTPGTQVTLNIYRNGVEYTGQFTVGGEE